jgi:hypothetical protein
MTRQESKIVQKIITVFLFCMSLFWIYYVANAFMVGKITICRGFKTCQTFGLDMPLLFWSTMGFGLVLVGLMIYATIRMLLYGKKKKH